MKIIRKPFPVDSYGAYYDDCELVDELNVDIFKEAGVQEIRYYYGCGRYDGVGQMVLRKDNKWHLFSLGHCSCYGPLDDVVSMLISGGQEGEDSLKALYEKCTEDLKKEIEILIKKGENE